MNTSKLADIAEITSSIAIFVTLVFLVVQMQQNTEAIQAQSRDTTFIGTQDRMALYMSNPDLEMLRHKSELTDEEKVRLFWRITMFIRAREHDWTQYQNGVLDEVVWQSYTAPIQVELSGVNSRKLWAYTRAYYNPRFVESVDAILADAPLINRSTALASFD